ncbi:hypothetical protein PSCICJ_04000 [Pseudomonas cichorii]|nr:hypothetical protein PSCICJ_04000 [Pseudomonas cichorii]
MCSLLMVGGPGAAQAGGSTAAIAELAVQPLPSRIWMTVREKRFAITLADTEAAREFIAMLPLSIEMPDLNSNEKHATLSKSLSRNEIRPGIIRTGDLMLYGSQTLVVFYRSFTSPYSYTRLGHVDDTSGFENAVGRDAAKIEFSKN